MIYIVHTYDPLNPIVFSFGSISVSWYALLILSGALLGLFLGIRNAKKLKLDTSKIYDGFVYGLLIGIIGARLYYVLFNLDIYLEDPIRILFINEGGLAIHGGVIAAGIFIYFYSKKHGLNLFKLVEIVFPYFLLAQAIGRWGNFMNQEAFGPMIAGSVDQGYDFLKHTLHLPEFIVQQMYIEGPSGLGYYHPTFLYESVFNLIGFFVIIFGLRKLKSYWVGDGFIFYLGWYGVVRFFIETLRTDALMFGPIKIAELVSVLMLISAIVLKYFRSRFKIYPLVYKDAISGANLEFSDFSNKENAFKAVKE